MRLLFVIGAGILPEQRIKRWQMVSQLYARLARGFQRLGHQVYFYVHPDAYHEDIPPALTWQCHDHEHLQHVFDNFQPEFVFCWNGSSAGDITTATLAQANGAKMVYSEQGWFPQAPTLYFDLAGCNGKCGTKNRTYPRLTEEQANGFLSRRKAYIKTVAPGELFDAEHFTIRPPDLSKPVFVPLQDERDLNIVQDSPFKTMDDFVSFVANRYHQQRFVVRPHPKYPNPALKTYPNVVLDDPKRPMFESLAGCGMVIGINSTTLLESALLGFTVISMGESLATGTGLFVDARPQVNVPTILDTLRVDSEAAQSVLHHLLCVKQMQRDALDDPAVLMRSNLFRELTQNLNWNSIYR